jgi:hypothetical protein
MRGHVLLSLIMLCALAACGGSGDSGGGGSPGAPGSGSGAFSMDRSSVTMVGSRQANRTPQELVTVRLSDSGAAAVVAGYRAGVAPASWLDVDVSGGQTTFRFLLTANRTGLANGTYSTTLTIATENSAGATLKTQELPVSLTLRDGIGILNANHSTVHVVEGSNQTSQTGAVQVVAPAGAQWTASSNVAWLVIPAGPFTGPQTLTANVNLDGLNPQTSQTATVTVRNSSDAVDFDITEFHYTIEVPDLTLDTAPILLGGETGIDYQPKPLTMSLDTGGRGHPFTAVATMTSNAAQVHSTVASGTVSGSTTNFSVEAVDAANTPPGSYTGSLRVSIALPYTVLTRDIPITYNVDANRLMVDYMGVAFSSFPSRQILSRSVHVYDTRRLGTISWQAASNAAWLQVTATGLTGSPLTLAADPSGLADGQHFAEVTITTSNAQTSGTEKIRVGLNKRAADPPATVTVSTVTGQVCTNPVEPEIYVTQGAEIRVYDAYSGALLRTLPALSATPDAITTSDDGRVLYALVSAKAIDSRILAINPADGTLLATHLLPFDGFSQATEFGLAYRRPDARPLLISSVAGQVFDLTAGAQVASAVGYYSDAWSPDGRFHYLADNVNITARQVFYSSMPNVGLRKRDFAVTSVRQQAQIPLNPGSAVGLSSDGTRLFLQAIVVSAPDLVYERAFVNQRLMSNIRSSWNGRIAANGQGSVNNSGLKVWVFDDAGTPLAELDPPAGSSFISPEFTGDGTRLVQPNSTSFKILTVP